MPSQINVQLTGRIQNLIFYKVGDKYYARTTPSRVKQTKATKKRASEFGKASRVGKSLRQQLLSVIPFPADNKMQTRLVSALFQWLRHDTEQSSDPMLYIGNFQFTEGYSVLERWKVNLQITKPAPDMLALKIPAFIPSKSISAPAGTIAVKCHIAIAGCEIETGIATGGFSTSILFDYNEVEVPEQKVNLPVPTTSGSLVVTAIFLEYNSLKNGHLEKTKNKAFMPAGMVSAMYF